MSNKALTDKQKQFYKTNGYLIGLKPPYDEAGVKWLNEGLNSLMNLLGPGEDSKEIREWHESSRFLFDICMNDKILDHVEDVLGPNFYLWGSNFFIKEPHSKTTVGWHQDTYYWPLEPKISATVWLAFEEASKENGAMQVIPGSHVTGLLKHRRSTDTDSVLSLECEGGTFREDSAVSLVLKAGQFSMHDDKLVHGSPANPSSKRRAGLTIRYSSTEVKCDLSINPHFTTYLCRGVDEFHHNPVGKVPTQMFGRLVRKHVSVEEAGVEAEKKLGLVRN
jgi:non-heme Fe2+,alpha-ketoglutarate-dependent halogenase